MDPGSTQAPRLTVIINLTQAIIPITVAAWRNGDGLLRVGECVVMDLGFEGLINEFEKRIGPGAAQWFTRLALVSGSAILIFAVVGPVVVAVHWVHNAITHGDGVTYWFGMAVYVLALVGTSVGFSFGLVKWLDRKAERIWGPVTEARKELEAGYRELDEKIAESKALICKWEQMVKDNNTNPPPGDSA